MQAILTGLKEVDYKIVYGAISCTICMPILLATIKYVVIAIGGNNQVSFASPYASMEQSGVAANFRFVITECVFHNLSQFSLRERLIIAMYEVVKRLGISRINDNELAGSDVIVEELPIMTTTTDYDSLKRVDS